MRGDSLTPEGDAAYWSMRYTIRGGMTEDHDVPVFLASSMDAILVTGAVTCEARASAAGPSLAMQWLVGVETVGPNLQGRPTSLQQ